MVEKFYAAIDLGTNSCRLLIADSKGRPVYQDSMSTRLGEGMQATSMLTDEAIARGLDCFEQFHNVMKDSNIVAYRAIGTAACRSAKNAGDFIRKVYDKTGIHIEVVTPSEEARLNLKGAISHVRNKSEYAIVVDQGGGSTEIVLAQNGDNPSMLSAVSIPWGSRTAADAFQLETYDKLNAARLTQEIKRWVDGFKHSSNFDAIKENVSFVATSSTPLRLASLIRKCDRYDRDKCDGLQIKTKDVFKVLEDLKTASVEDMAKNPNIGFQRAPIFLSGVIMLGQIFSELGAEKVVASLRSAKDGIIEELIQNDKVKVRLQQEVSLESKAKNGKTN